MKFMIPVLLLHLLAIPALFTPVAFSADTKRNKPLSLAAGICVNKAQLEFQAGDVHKAIRILEDFMTKRLGKGHHYIHFMLGNYYMMLSQSELNVVDQEADQNQTKAALQRAMKSYENCIIAAPSFSAGWLNLAKCRYESEDFKGAANAFEKGYETADPELSKRKAIHLYYAAVCHFQAQNHEKSLTLFNRLLAVHPNEVTLNWKEILVNLLFSLERYKNALPYIEELARKSPIKKRKKWQETLLHQYLYLAMDKKALNYAELLTRTDPLEPKWWKGLSHIHLKNNHSTRGLAALIIYGFLTPITQEETELVADLYLFLDIPKKAAEYYRDLIQEEEDPKILEKLAQAYALAHDPDNAIKWIDKGLLAFAATAESEPEKVKLKNLKKQLLYTQRFFAKVSTVLQPDTP